MHTVVATQGKNGSPVIPPRQAEISGVWVQLYPIPDGFAVDKNGARLLMTRKLGIKPRQVRAAISSYSVEAWVHRVSNGATLFGVSSLDNRMLDHLDRRDDSRRENGKKGGRPPKPSWDVTAGWLGRATDVSPKSVW